MAIVFSDAEPEGVRKLDGFLFADGVALEWWREVSGGVRGDRECGAV
jgi:hypothetical protein